MLRGVQSLLESFLAQRVNRGKVKPRGREFRAELNRLVKRHDSADRDAYRSSARHCHHALAIKGERPFWIKLRRAHEVFFRFFELGPLKLQKSKAFFGACERRIKLEGVFEFGSGIVPPAVAQVQVPNARLRFGWGQRVGGRNGLTPAAGQDFGGQ
jgi:hypothetical protein